MHIILEEERLNALEKWARRAVNHAAGKVGERRRAVRVSRQCQMVLVGLVPNSFTPDLRRKCTVMLKDLSEQGLAFVTDRKIAGEFYYAKIDQDKEILLIRMVRARAIRGSICEHGAEIISRMTPEETLLSFQA